MGCVTSTVKPQPGILKTGSNSSKGSSIAGSRKEVSFSHKEIVPVGQQPRLEYFAAKDNSANLFAAIKKGDLVTVTDIMERSLAIADDRPVNSLLGMWNSTPLIVAIQYNKLNVINVLLRQSDLGDIDHMNDKGASALLYACMEGLTEIVLELLKLGAKITTQPTLDPIYNSATDKTLKCTPLSIAVTNGHQKIVAALLDAGAKINQPFHFATALSIFRGSAAAAAGASTLSTKPLVMVQSDSGDSLGRLERQSSRNSKKSAADGGEGAGLMTPIMLACAHARLNVVRELLYRNCDCTLLDDEEATLLHHLARSRAALAPVNQLGVSIFMEIQKYLQSCNSPSKQAMSSTSNSEHNNNNDRKESAENISHEIDVPPPLLYNGRTGAEVLEQLLSTADAQGDTPLLVACENKNVPLMKILLEEGHCAPGSCNKETGVCALHIAIRKRSQDMVQVLLEYGADPLQKDFSGVSCSDIASKLHPDSAIYKLVDTAAQAWRLLRGNAVTKAQIEKAERKILAAEENFTNKHQQLHLAAIAAAADSGSGSADSNDVTVRAVVEPSNSNTIANTNSNTNSNTSALVQQLGGGEGEGEVENGGDDSLEIISLEPPHGEAHGCADSKEEGGGGGGGGDIKFIAIDRIVGDTGSVSQCVEGQDAVQAFAPPPYAEDSSNDDDKDRDHGEAEVVVGNAEAEQAGGGGVGDGGSVEVQVDRAVMLAAEAIFANMHNFGAASTDTTATTTTTRNSIINTNTASKQNSGSGDAATSGVGDEDDASPLPFGAVAAYTHGSASAKIMHSPGSKLAPYSGSSVKHHHHHHHHHIVSGLPGSDASSKRLPSAANSAPVSRKDSNSNRHALFEFEVDPDTGLSVRISSRLRHNTLVEDNNSSQDTPDAGPGFHINTSALSGFSSQSSADQSGENSKSDSNSGTPKANSGARKYSSSVATSSNTSSNSSSSSTTNAGSGGGGSSSGNKLFMLTSAGKQRSTTLHTIHAVDDDEEEEEEEGINDEETNRKNTKMGKNGAEFEVQQTPGVKEGREEQGPQDSTVHDETTERERERQRRLKVQGSGVGVTLVPHGKGTARKSSHRGSSGSSGGGNNGSSGKDSVGTKSAGLAAKQTRRNSSSRKPSVTTSKGATATVATTSSASTAAPVVAAGAAASSLKLVDTSSITSSVPAAPTPPSDQSIKQKTATLTNTTTTNTTTNTNTSTTSGGSSSSNKAANVVTPRRPTLNRRLSSNHNNNNNNNNNNNDNDNKLTSPLLLRRVSQSKNNSNKNNSKNNVGSSGNSSGVLESKEPTTIETPSSSSQASNTTINNNTAAAATNISAAAATPVSEAAAKEDMVALATPPRKISNATTSGGEGGGAGGGSKSAHIPRRPSAYIGDAVTPSRAKAGNAVGTAATSAIVASSTPGPNNNNKNTMNKNGTGGGGGGQNSFRNSRYVVRKNSKNSANTSNKNTGGSQGTNSGSSDKYDKSSSGNNENASRKDNDLCECCR